MTILLVKPSYSSVDEQVPVPELSRAEVSETLGQFLKVDSASSGPVLSDSSFRKTLLNDSELAGLLAQSSFPPFRLDMGDASGDEVLSVLVEIGRINEMLGGHGIDALMLDDGSPE